MKRLEYWKNITMISLQSLLAFMLTSDILGSNCDIFHKLARYI